MAAKVNKKDDDGPNMLVTTAAHDFMAPKWAMIDALLGGTETMRAAGQTYLPQYEEESDKRYAARLAMTVLLNLTKFTLSNLVGRVFKNPIVFKDDVPKPIKELTEDVNGQGDNVQVVAYRWFEQGFAKGLTHMLIDMPPKPVPAEGKVLTKADDVGRKPYWVHIAPENLLFAYSETVNGVEVLKQVHILEEVSTLRGYEEVCDIQVRVLKIGLYEIWKYKEVKVGGKLKKQWYMASSGPMDIKDKDGVAYIPLVTFYTKRKGLALSDLPLEDLAHLNVEHWQSKSDQRNILTAARFPILAMSGSTGEDESTGNRITIGPYNMLTTPDPQGRVYYVEHTGAAIGAGRQDLRDLEDQMASYGAQFLKKKADIESATARILDSSETISELQAIALNFKDALEQALKVTADWMGIKEGGGSVELDAGLSLAIDGTDLQTLTEARKNRDLSRKSYLTELRRRDVLSDDFDEELNLEELQEENDLGMSEGDGLDETGTDPGDETA